MIGDDWMKRPNVIVKTSKELESNEKMQKEVDKLDVDWEALQEFLIQNGFRVITTNQQYSVLSNEKTEVRIPILKFIHRLDLQRILSKADISEDELVNFLEIE